jgi:hypothetical protein
MGKIVLDRRGDLRKGVFYRFNVQFNDDLTPETPSADWVIAPRTPTSDELIDKGQPAYLRVEDLPAATDRIETKDCPADLTHVTHRYYKAAAGDAMGYSRLSPFVETSHGTFFGLSPDLCQRLQTLNVEGAKIDPVRIIVNQSNIKDPKVWALQFVGTAKLRLPKFIDATNSCPHCGKTKVLCESCGDWRAYCKICERQMVIIESAHKGDADSRIPFETGLKDILEGKTWDGSDLVQAGFRNFASKRFIDWLLRTHAAPFYAEPVWFCVDGMNDRQKRWFDDLQKPFEA